VQTPAAAGYGFGASITRSGLVLLPATITMFAAGMFAGRLTRWPARRRPAGQCLFPSPLSLVRPQIRPGVRWYAFSAR
jgi:hypothetical protein